MTEIADIRRDHNVVPLSLSASAHLTTTRSVRKRLVLGRPVPRSG